MHSRLNPRGVWEVLTLAIAVLGLVLGGASVAFADPEADGCQTYLQTYPPALVGVSCVPTECITGPPLYCELDVSGAGCVCIGFNYLHKAPCASNVYQDPVWGWSLSCYKNDCESDCLKVKIVTPGIFTQVQWVCACP